MMQKSRLFINIEDKNKQQLLGTLVHYQVGIGSWMLMSALNLILNYTPTPDQSLYGQPDMDIIYQILHDDCGLPNPKQAIAIRQNLIKNIGNHGVINTDTTEFEDDAAYFNVLCHPDKYKGNIQELKDAARFTKWPELKKPATKEKFALAYTANYQNFADRCHNEDHDYESFAGYMVINFQYDRAVTNNDPVSLADKLTTQVGFGINGPNDNECVPVDYQRFCKELDLQPDFTLAYLNMLHAFNISSYTPAEFKQRMV